MPADAEGQAGDRTETRSDHEVATGSAGLQDAVPRTPGPEVLTPICWVPRQWHGQEGGRGLGSDVHKHTPECTPELGDTLVFALK